MQKPCSINSYCDMLSFSTCFSPCLYTLCNTLTVQYINFSSYNIHAIAVKPVNNPKSIPTLILDAELGDSIGLTLCVGVGDGPPATPHEVPLEPPLLIFEAPCGVSSA